MTTTPSSVSGPTPPTTAAEPTIACFDAAPTVMLGRQIRLDASCSSPRGSLIYEWDLGDGRRRAGRVISPVYRVPGTYTIELTVRQQSSDSALDTDLMTQQIEVQAQPSPGLPSPTGSAGGSADLAVEMVGILTPRILGRFGIIYLITVTNFGPGAATGVTVTDSLPPTVSLNGVSGALCSTAGTTLTCDLTSLPAFSSKTLTVVVRVFSSVSVGETLFNTATVTAATSDPSLGNNTATSVVQIVISQKAPDGSAPMPTSFTSSLEGWPTTVHGNVLSNGNQLDAVHSSTPFHHQVRAVLGRNRIEAYLESTSEAEGIWRFDFSRAQLFVSGSFEVRQGRVLSQSSHAIVFQLHGNMGQRIEWELYTSLPRRRVGTQFRPAHAFFLKYRHSPLGFGFPRNSDRATCSGVASMWICSLYLPLCGRPRFGSCSFMVAPSVARLS